MTDFSRRGMLTGLAGILALAVTKPARAAFPGRRLRLNRSVAGRVSPSTQWGISGVAGSGFGGSNPAAPTDPTRVTAKPRVRLLTVPFQTVAGDIKIVVAATAKGGIANVEFMFEGNTVATGRKTVSTYTDTNGVTNKAKRGYACTLDYSTWLALNATGSAQLYIRVTARDGTMQQRVIGPYLFHARAPGIGAGLQYDTSVTITPSQPQVGTNYQTALACLTAMKSQGKIRPLITVTENCNLDFTTGLSTTFTSVGTWAILTHAPGVTANIVTTGFTTARIKYGGLCYRGSGIVFKPDQFTQLYAEDNDNVWLDGCQVIGAGQYAMFGNSKNVPQVSLLRSAAPAPVWWVTDANLSDYYNGFSGCELVLNCTLSRMAGDALQNSRCVQGCVVDTMSTGPLRDPAQNLSLTVTNNTGQTVTIQITNAANSSTRVATVTVGATPNTFNIDQVTTGANWRFSDFATFLTGLGITPTVLSDAMRLVFIQMPGIASAPTAGFNGGSASTGGIPLVIPNGSTVTIGANIDDHADVNQNFSSGLITSNVLFQYNTFKNIGSDIQTIFLDHTASNFQDCDWSYNLIIGGLRSFVNSPESHVTFKRNTFAGAPFNWVVSNSAMTSTTATIVGNVLTIPGTTLSYKYLVAGMTVTGTGVTAGTVVQSVTHQFDGTNTVAVLNNGGMNVGPGITITIQPSGENFRPDAYCEHVGNAYDSAAWTTGTGGVPNALAGIDTNFLRSGSIPATATNSVLGGGVPWTSLVQDAANSNYAPLAGQMIAGDGSQIGAFLPNGQYNEAA